MKNIKLKNAVIAVVVTNLITAAFLIFVQIPFIGGKRLVSGTEYEFIKKYEKLIKVENIVKSNYVDKNEINQNTLVDGAISGMVDSIGDPYTVYLDKKQYEELLTQTRGTYGGVGIVVGEKEGKLTVVAPIEDGPAERLGIKAGDVILKVDGKEISAKDIDKAVTMMRGKEGTKVILTIFREGRGVKDYEITREIIVLKTVKSQVLDGNIGYIRITSFDENTASEFKKALDSLKNQNIKGLVLDLRDNPGGLLDESVAIADMLLPQGTIVYTIDNKGEKESWKSQPDNLGLPLAVLVNEGSASASEILSGAIRDFKAGTLIGTKTFGKGLVQNIIDLKDGTGVKVTIARYYTPNGECIQGKGIMPDIVYDLPKEQKEKEPTLEQDMQIKKALEVLKAKLQ
ncbi:Carboxy-terminal processing protease CtpA precursor [Caloramator mitchellensis]|uniref:Carboxy-terminal processing protease CtpA n=1 Tax=Caloramator mitchellensis TaxID=908809 RepID=A0A0R3JU96_CALMK|nr:S41 family peptidase [Caloramator mitchellensis]KRQ87120.1 Carboxy-terminal processing protease CtpA precursor [Caloramator mitchellensis]